MKRAKSSTKAKRHARLNAQRDRRWRNAPITIVRTDLSSGDIPATCVPNGARDDLSLPGYGMLATLRSYRSQGIEPELAELAEIGGCTEEEARVLVEEVRASGWLDVKGCPECPAGHRCTRSEPMP